MKNDALKVSQQSRVLCKKTFKMQSWYRRFFKKNFFQNSMEKLGLLLYFDETQNVI